MHLTNDSPRVPMELDDNFGSEPEQALCERQIRLCRKRLWIRKRIRDAQPPLSGNVRKHALFHCLAG
jgi:hypothetical protein